MNRLVVSIPKIWKAVDLVKSSRDDASDHHCASVVLRGVESIAGLSGS